MTNFHYIFFKFLQNFALNSMKICLPPQISLTVTNSFEFHVGVYSKLSKSLLVFLTIFILFFCEYFCFSHWRSTKIFSKLFCFPSFYNLIPIFCYAKPRFQFFTKLSQSCANLSTVYLTIFLDYQRSFINPLYDLRNSYDFLPKSYKFFSNFHTRLYDSTHHSVVPLRFVRSSFLHRRFTIAVSSTFFLFLNINFRWEIISFRLVFFSRFWIKAISACFGENACVAWKFSTIFWCYFCLFSWDVFQCFSFFNDFLTIFIWFFHKIHNLPRNFHLFFTTFRITLVDSARWFICSRQSSALFIIYVTNLSSIASKFDQSIDVVPTSNWVLFSTV